MGRNAEGEPIFYLNLNRATLFLRIKKSSTRRLAFWNNPERITKGSIYPWNLRSIEGQKRWEVRGHAML